MQNYKSCEMVYNKQVRHKGELSKTHKQCLPAGTCIYEYEWLNLQHAKTPPQPEEWDTPTYKTNNL